MRFPVLFVLFMGFFIPASYAQLKVVKESEDRYFLHDAANNRVIFRGVNVSYYGSGSTTIDTSASGTVVNIANAIKTNTRCNAVRLFWLSTTVGGSAYALPSLEFIIKTYLSKNIIPVIYLYDITYTGDNTVGGFNTYVTPFWTNASVISLIKKYQDEVVINLANEWGATYNDLDANGANYVSEYNGLITQLRTAGITCPIMIDAVNSGTDPEYITALQQINGATSAKALGQYIISNDPLGNILFSVHTYWARTYEQVAAAGCITDYQSRMDNLMNSNLPFVIGEASNWADPTNSIEVYSPPISFNCSTINTTLNDPGINVNDPVTDSDPVPYWNGDSGTTGLPVPSHNTNILFTINYDALLSRTVTDSIGYFAWTWYQDGTVTRCIYNHDTGLTQNTSSYAGSWPTDILSATKTYGLKNVYINPVIVGNNWIGVTSTNWMTGSNWSASIVPGSNSNVIIPSGTPFSPTIPNGVTTSCYSLSVMTGALVTVGTKANLIVTH